MDTTLSYKIASKEPFLVVSFSGSLTRSCIEVLEKCETEVVSTKAKYVVLNMQEAESLERPLIAALVKLQKHIRDNAEAIRICNLNPDLHKMLYEAGALRHLEVVEGLKEALSSLAQTSKMPKSAA